MCHNKKSVDKVKNSSIKTEKEGERKIKRRKMSSRRLLLWVAAVFQGRCVKELPCQIVSSAFGQQSDHVVIRTSLTSQVVQLIFACSTTCKIYFKRKKEGTTSKHWTLMMTMMKYLRTWNRWVDGQKDGKVEKYVIGINAAKC